MSILLAVLFREHSFPPAEAPVATPLLLPPPGESILEVPLSVRDPFRGASIQGPTSHIRMTRGHSQRNCRRHRQIRVHLNTSVL
jgi:hypothetical protein